MVAATTGAYLHSRCEVISLGMVSLKQNRLEILVLDWKPILKEQYGKRFLTQLCSRFLTKNDWAPRKDETMRSCFLLTISWVVLVKILCASINKPNRISIKFKNHKKK